MITAFQILIFLMAMCTIPMLIWQKHKILIILIGLSAGIGGFLVEASRISWGLWSYGTNSGAMVLQVPYLTIMAYFLGGLAAAMLAIDPSVKEFFKKFEKHIFVALIIVGIIYTVLAKDGAYLLLVLALFLYSKLNGHSHLLMVAITMAALDLILENLVLIPYGFINYAHQYDSSLYMGCIFTGFLFFGALTTYIISRQKK
ncbi:MAG: hypothetical protein NTY99_01295 [DPANN group archaeon]|nr:hypothetical protein [DPANN group archaeon]